MSTKISLSDLILRFLRVTPHTAYDGNAIKTKVIHLYTLIDEKLEDPINDRHISLAINSLMVEGFIMQHNYHYYSITNDGISYTNRKYPLFVMVPPDNVQAT